MSLKVCCTCPEGAMNCRLCDTLITWTIPNPMCELGRMSPTHWERVKASSSRSCPRCEDAPTTTASTGYDQKHQ